MVAGPTRAASRPTIRALAGTTKTFNYQTFAQLYFQVVGVKAVVAVNFLIPSLAQFCAKRPDPDLKYFNPNSALWSQMPICQRCNKYLIIYHRFKEHFRKKSNIL
jgi:hypothetical protein